MSQMRSPNEAKAAAPDATVEYSRAALNLVNREVPRLLKTVKSETDDHERSSAKARVEWYFRLAGMLNEHHPGYFDTGAEKDDALGLPSLSNHKQKVRRIVPICQQCGSPIIPGTEYTQCRVVSTNKRKRKRQPRKEQCNRQPKALADHPDLEITEVKSAKNNLVLTCRLCGDKCIIPALERRIKEKPLPVKKVNIPAVREDVAMGDRISNLDIIRLDEQVPHPMDPPPKKSKTSKNVVKPQKKRKKKKQSGESPLTNFLNSLNN